MVRIIKLSFFVGLTFSVSSQQEISFLGDIFGYNSQLYQVFKKIDYKAENFNLQKREVVIQRKKYLIYLCEADTVNRIFVEEAYRATRKSSIKSKYEFSYTELGKLKKMTSTVGLMSYLFELNHFEDSIVIYANGTNFKNHRISIVIRNNKVETLKKLSQDDKYNFECKIEYDSLLPKVIKCSNNTQINYEYDQKGNIVKDENHHYEYYPDNRLMKVKGTEFFYNKAIKDVEEIENVHTFYYSEDNDVERIDVYYPTKEQNNYYIIFNKEGYNKKIAKIYDSKRGKVIKEEISHYR